jgi:hypothetical protein
MESLNEVDLESSNQSIEIKKELDNSSGFRQSFGINNNKIGLESISEDSEISIEI